MSEKHTWLCIVLVAALGCAPDESDPYLGAALEWETESLHYYRSAAVAPACAGVSEYLDSYADTLRARFSLAEGGEVSFVYVSAEELPCSSIACTKGNIVYSTEAVQEHELVHGVRSYGGFSHLLIEEGAAEFFGDDSQKYEFRFDTAGAIEDAAEAIESSLPTEFYGVAGRLYAFLAEQAGADQLVDLLSATVPESSTEELSESLETTTGLRLHEWSETFAGYDVCDQQVFRDATPMCEVVQSVARCDGTDAILMERFVGCSEPGVLGPRDGEVWTYATIQIPEAGEYGIFIDALSEEVRATFSIKACSGGCGSGFRQLEVPTALTPATAVELSAGSHLLRMGVREGAEALFRVVISGPDCQ